MSRWICIDELEYDTDWDSYADGFTAYSQLAIDTAPSLDLVTCAECKYKEKCEQIVVFDIRKNQLEGRKIDACSYGKREDE